MVSISDHRRDVPDTVCAVMKRVVLFSYNFDTHANYITPVEGESYYQATMKAERIRESILAEFPDMHHVIISEEQTKQR